jgi:hypothetical protein
MFASPDVMHLFANELSGLSARRFSQALGFPGPLEGLFFRHTLIPPFYWYLRNNVEQYLKQMQQSICHGEGSRRRFSYA